MLEWFFKGFGIIIGIESLDQKIAKQQEKLNQLKAQKKAAIPREKAKKKEQ
ncbi:mobilization protein, partial [Acinetobacter defluvii]